MRLGAVRMHIAFERVRCKTAPTGEVHKSYNSKIYHSIAYGIYQCQEVVIYFRTYALRRCSDGAPCPSEPERPQGTETPAQQCRE